MFNEIQKRFTYCLVSQILEVDIIADNKPIYHKCLSVLKHFFTIGAGTGDTGGRAPLKGFLFEGQPGTGKTELVRQIAREFGAWTRPLYTAPGKDEPVLLFLDGASIASPRWGDAEVTLREAFRFADIQGRRTILLFDDIESLMLARSSEIAKEWHYSINAILFHELDAVDPKRTFVFATTNRPDLIDKALRDRLYPIEFRLPSRESLLEIATYQLRAMGDIPEQRQAEILNVIENELDKRKSPTIRDVERLVIMECVERNVWAT